MHDISRYILFVIVFFGFISANAQSQLIEAGETMKQIMQEASNRGLFIKESGVVDVGHLCSGQKIKVEIHNHIVRDIGLLLFADDDFSVYSPVYKYIERYFLHLLLKANKKEQAALLRENRVELIVNDTDFHLSELSFPDILKAIDKATTFNLNEFEKSFQAQWIYGTKNESVSFFFPKQYDLILGLDKKELTAQMIDEMNHFTYAATQTGHPDIAFGQYDSLTRSYADLMGKKNKIRMAIRSFLVTDSLDYTVDRLTAFMKQQGCKAYIGLESESDTAFTGTIFYVNKVLMYEHICSFSFPKEAFKKEDAQIQAKLSLYIPLNNIKTLYDDD